MKRIEHPDCDAHEVVYYMRQILDGGWKIVKFEYTGDYEWYGDVVFFVEKEQSK